MKLPVTVVLPTLNCKDKLIKHLDGIESWLPDVAQIIAIDSQSNDGTLELLKERLLPYEAEIVSAERGLYQCWNKAAQLASQPYLYYSTICDIITRDGIVELADIIEKNKLDVVISPPIIVSGDGRIDKKIKWPIHYVEKYLEYTNGLAIFGKNDMEFLVTLFLPASIIGSSASNLYRSEVIKSNPFPLHVGTVGDSFWALQNLPSLRVGIAEKAYATFCWDGVRNGTWDESGEIMKKFQAEAKLLHHGNNIMRFVNEVLIPSTNAHLRDECIRLQDVIDEYDDYVKFLTRPIGVKARDVILKYTSVRYWLGKIVPRE